MAESNDFGVGYAMGMDSNRNNGGFFGGEGLWAIIILAMLGFGGGFGGGGMNGGGFALNSLDNGIRGIQNGLCDGFYAVNTGLLTGFGNMQQQMASCCCETQRLIERGFCDTNANIVNQTRAILDFLTSEKIDSLRTENQTLKFQASQANQNAFITANQEAQTAELIRRLGKDTPVPAYIVQPSTPLNFPTNGFGTIQFGGGYGNYGGYGGCGGYAGCGCG